MEGPSRAWRQFKIIAEMIKIEHTLFSLPFACMGALLAAGGLPDLRTVLWILAAMVGGRSAAMAFNRLADAELDARNPRTAGRALPQGLLKKTEVGLFIAVSAALFLLSAWMLNLLCFILAWPVLVILLGYSYMKRFTWFCHFFLGFCLGLPPLAGWLAVRGTLDLVPILFSLGVLFWTAGFDVIYACQDYETDCKEGLRSIPTRFGLRGALWLSAGLPVLTVFFFCAGGWTAGLAWPYWTALAIATGSLVFQHAIVKPSNLSRINTAFFTANGFISITMAVGTFLAI